MLHRMYGREEMPGALEWRVSAFYKYPNIDPNDLLGTHATVSVKTDNSLRQFALIGTKTL